MAPLVAALIKGGLPILAKALVTHGKDWVEEKTGIDRPSMEEPELTAEQLGQLRVAELKHKDTLTEAIATITGAEIADVVFQIAADAHARSRRAERDRPLRIPRALHRKPRHAGIQPANEEPEPARTRKGTIRDPPIGDDHRNPPRAALPEKIEPQLGLH